MYTYGIYIHIYMSFRAFMLSDWLQDFWLKLMWHRYLESIVFALTSASHRPTPGLAEADPVWLVLLHHWGVLWLHRNRFVLLQPIAQTSSGCTGGRAYQYCLGSPPLGRTDWLDFGYIGSSRLDFTDPRVYFILALVSRLSIFNIYLLSFRPMGWLSGARCLKSRACRRSL